jgi:putative oxidoreductase
VFRDGYEYVLVVGVSALDLAAIGPGRVSVDSIFGVVDYGNVTAPGLLGVNGALVAAIGGLLGGAGLLAVGWRPIPTVTPATDEEGSL